MQHLITSTQAAEIAGITPSTFRTLAVNSNTKTPPPQPVAFVGGVRLYHRDEVTTWAVIRDRKRGRPATA